MTGAASATTNPAPRTGRTFGDVVLDARHISRTFQMGSTRLQILRDASIAVRRGEFVAIEGRSGSGKSTLLHLLGLLDEPDTYGDVGATVAQRQIVIDGRDALQLSSADRCRLRNGEIGFVFQFYHLLPELDVMGNTMLAAMVRHSAFGFGRARTELRERAVSILERMGLRERLHHRPNQLSGGERQRVAIARALMNEPKLLLADEPTGNLDYETGRQIMDVLNALHDNGQTVVMVTHDRALARQADRVLVLQKGQLVAA